MSKDGYPHFSPAEMARRFDAARAIMDDKGVDALLVFGHSGNRRHYQADVHYFAQVALFHESYLMIPRTGEPKLWTTHNNHYLNACELTSIEDVGQVHRSVGAAATMAGELKARGLGEGRLGLVGPFFYQDIDGLRKELPNATMSDLSLPIKRLRSRKSADEIAWQRKAALGCDAVMEALKRELRPGVAERDIQTIAETAARAAGCEFTFLYLNSTPMAASESCVPNQMWSHRKLRPGDVINTELTVNYGMYCSQILRPFFLGAPTEQYQHIYRTMKDTYDALWATVKHGTTLQELYEVSLMIRDAGYTTVDGIAHGFGVDIQPPSGVPYKFIPPNDPNETLDEGMTFVIQPNPTTKDHKAGMQLGDLGLVTATGFENMHRYPAEVTAL